MVAGLICRQALVQGTGGVLQQLRRATLNLWRLGTLGAEPGKRLRPFTGFDFGRRLTGQVGEVVGFVTLGLGRIGSEAGDIGRQVPALTLVELVGKRRHVGAFDTQAERIVQVEQAQTVEPLGAAQVRRRRGQAEAGRAVASAGIAMAHRAMLGIQRRAAARVRGNDRRLADFISHRQLRAEQTGLTGDARAVLTLADRLTQIDHTLLQGLALRTRRQGDDQPLKHIDELELLAVFPFVNDLACLNGGRVIGTDVIEQVQGLGSAIGAVGQQCGTAQRQHRPEQPGE
ncbi:hypothetical protein D3C81_666370 [compost metagenome]